jgi:ABC-type lipoprotein release transport system permease subunit
MYSSGAMVLMDGLQEGSGSVVARLKDGPFLAYRGEFPGLMAFRPPEGLEGAFALGRLHAAILLAGNSAVEVRVFSLSDPRVLGMAEGPEEGQAYVPQALVERLNLEIGSPISLTTLDGESELMLTKVLKPAVSLPDTWVVVSEADLVTMFNLDPGTYDFLLLEERRDALRLQAEGFSLISLSSAADFFTRGLEEARRVVLSIVVASSMAIAALAFTLLSLEVRYRQREMETLRALGMDRWGFARLYGMQLAFILLSGSLLGLAMGIVVANGLVSFSPFFGMATVIRPQVTLNGILLPLLSSLTAGAIGGVATVFLTLRRLSHGSPA